MKSSTGTYYLVYLSTVVAVLLLVGAINYVVDPYGVWGSGIYKFNHSKPKTDSHERLFKAAEVIRKKPDVIYLGTSRVLQGIRPAEGYNLAIHASEITEQVEYFRHALTNTKLKKVTIGLDFHSFNINARDIPTDADPSRLARKRLPLKDAFRCLASWDALGDSLDTYLSNRKNPDYTVFGESGEKTDDRIARMAAGRSRMQMFEFALTFYISHPGLYNGFKLGNIDAFKSLVETCGRYDIELTALFTPPHAAELELIKQQNLWSVYEQWKRELVAITPVYDFSGYNPVTTEKISNEMIYYWDSTHFTKTVGDMIQRHAFGLRLTKSNIEQFLSRTRADQSKWELENSDIVRLVERVRHENLPRTIKRQRDRT